MRERIKPILTHFKLLSLYLGNRGCLPCVQFPKNAQFLFTIVLILSSLNLHAKDSFSGVYRKPANFVPDDDLIEVPIVIEKTYMDKFHEENESEFSQVKKQVENWQINDEKAHLYGLEDKPVFYISTQEQRKELFMRNYLRFFNKKVETDTRVGVQTLWKEWNSDDELKSIESAEKHEGYIVKSRKTLGKPSIKAERTVQVGKDEFKFNFQPRLEMGMAKVTIDSPYINMRAWIGVNGKQEVKLYRFVKSSKTNIQANYYIEDKRVLAALDQELGSHWSLRMTHDKQIKGFSSITRSGNSENNIIQVRFGMGF